jgi:hypothetical protein
MGAVARVGVDVWGTRVLIGIGIVITRVETDQIDLHRIGARGVGGVPVDARIGVCRKDHPWLNLDGL